MNKKEKRELQENLLQLVPYNIIETNEITNSTKILLGALIKLNGMDKVKKNGYLFRSLNLLKEDTQLSLPTIITSISKLIDLNFIKRTTGSRPKKASIYILDFEAINSFKSTTKINSNLVKITTKINSNDNFSSLVDEIKSLRLEIKELKDLIIGEEISTKIYSKNIDFSTDTDTEIEKDIIYNNTTIDNTTIGINTYNIDHTTSGPIEEEINKLNYNSNSDNINDSDDVEQRETDKRIANNNGDNLNENEDCETSEQREDDETDETTQKEIINETTHTSTQEVSKTDTTDTTEAYTSIGDNNNDTEVMKRVNNVNDEITDEIKEEITTSIDDSENTTDTPKNNSNENNGSPLPPSQPTVETRSVNKAVLSHENTSDIQTTVPTNKTQQGANTDPNWAYLESVCNRKNKKYDSMTADCIINHLNKMDISYKKKMKVIERYFEGITHNYPVFLPPLKNEMIKKIIN